jgi:hypothetical protein
VARSSNAVGKSVRLLRSHSREIRQALRQPQDPPKRQCPVDGLAALFADRPGLW